MDKALDNQPAQDVVAPAEPAFEAFGPAAPVPLGVDRMVVGHAEDPAEADADRRADSALSRLAALGGGPELHAHGPGCDHLRRSTGTPSGGAVVGHAGGELDGGTAAEIESRRGRGRPLDGPVLQRMQSAFSTSLSDVRIHDDPDAARLSRLVSARAFTTGKDVFFGAGEYRPSTPDGDRVLAHELAHTQQPAGGSVARLHRFTEEKKGELLQGQYKKRAEEYEFKLGFALSKHERALAGAKALSDKFKALLVASHGEGKEGAAYNPDKTSGGKVTKARAAEVFDSGNLRERMGTIYAAITNYEDPLFGLGAMLEGAVAEPVKFNKIADTALVSKEKGADGRGQMFGRRGRTGDRTQNDRQPKSNVELNKNLDSYFKGADAPTPNKVTARGEAPLSSREYEGAFPAETTDISSKNAGWAGLSEQEKVAAYAAVLGDKVLETWVGGENYNTLGPKLQAEGRNKNMRMLAGFSGTSDMYFHAGNYFKLAKKDLLNVRLAALGTMIPARDHSFHEIMSASKDYGLDYADGPVGYSRFEPFTGKELLDLTGAPFFPHELIGDAGKEAFDDETADGVDIDRVPKLPKRAALPKVTWGAKLGWSTSSYEAVLNGLDAYHKARDAKKGEHLDLADKLVVLVDAWMTKNRLRADDGDKAKITALEDLRAKALQAGSSWAVQATETNLTAQATKTKAAQTARADLTAPTSAVSAGGAFEMSPGVVNGLGEEAVIALSSLVASCMALAAKPPAADVSTLPEVGACADYQTLLTSAEGQLLVAAMGQNGELMLRTLVADFGASKVCKAIAPRHPDKVAWGQFTTSLNLLGANFAGVEVRVDGVGPRSGETYKVDGGGDDKRDAALAQAYKLTPLELDCIVGYTIGEYKKFNAGTATPERRAALISGLGKMPKASGPLYRGDYGYQNNPAYYRVGRQEPKTAFTSTGKSLADSFVPKRPTAHVYIDHKSAADVEALSRKTWEQEALFPGGLTFEVLAIVDKTVKPGERKDATLDTATGGLAGKHGLPTAAEQRRGGVGSASASDLKLEDPHLADAKWTEHFTKGFSDKVWIFWKEV